jgi:hypothetical protein
MIHTSPKNYGFIEGGREIHGGREYLAKLSAICARVLGGESVAATTDLQLVQGNDDEYTVGEVVTPIIRTKGCEIPPANELRVVLMSRSFKPEDAWRYPSTNYVKVKLAKPIKGIGQRHRPSLRQEFMDIAAAHHQKLESGETNTVHVRFSEVSYLPSAGSSRIVGLHLDPSHCTTKVLTEQAIALENRLKHVSSSLYKIEQPWNMAMAVARVDIPDGDSRANRLLEQLEPRLPQRMELGRILLAADDLVAG